MNKGWKTFLWVEIVVAICALIYFCNLVPVVECDKPDLIDR